MVAGWYAHVTKCNQKILKLMESVEKLDHLRLPFSRW